MGDGGEDLDDSDDEGLLTKIFLIFDLTVICLYWLYGR